MIAEMEDRDDKAQYEVIARNVVGVAFAGKYYASAPLLWLH